MHINHLTDLTLPLNILSASNSNLNTLTVHPLRAVSLLRFHWLPCLDSLLDYLPTAAHALNHARVLLHFHFLKNGSCPLVVLECLCVVLLGKVSVGQTVTAVRKSVVLNFVLLAES